MTYVTRCYKCYSVRPDGDNTGYCPTCRTEMALEKQSRDLQRAQDREDERRRYEEEDRIRRENDRHEERQTRAQFVRGKRIRDDDFYEEPEEKVYFIWDRSPREDTSTIPIHLSVLPIWFYRDVENSRIVWIWWSLYAKKLTSSDWKDLFSHAFDTCFNEREIFSVEVPHALPGHTESEMMRIEQIFFEARQARIKILRNQKREQILEFIKKTCGWVLVTLVAATIIYACWPLIKVVAIVIWTMIEIMLEMIRMIWSPVLKLFFSIFR